MANLKLPVFILISLLFIQCSAPNANRPSSNLAADYKKLMTGTWEGWYDGKPEMRVTFNGDDTMTVDYSIGRMRGRKFTVPYRLKDERTIEADHYSDNLVIEKITDDEFRFRPEEKKLRVDIDIIYECRFVRAIE